MTYSDRSISNALASGRKFRIFYVLLPLLIFLFVESLSTPSVAQVKVSDRNTLAFKESKKNKNKKKKKRQRIYRKSAKQNLTQSETNLVPEALKQQNLPQKQHIEKRPSKAFLKAERKQKRTIAHKTIEALKQGMNLSESERSRLRKVKKQSKMIARHQGDIPFVPLALRQKPNAVPQPQVNLNPGKTNLKTRNQKLAQYSLKSEEALNQGMVNGKTRKDRQQEQQSQSMVQSQFQGNFNFTPKQQESRYASTSRKNRKAGMKKQLSPKQKEAEYMARSVDNQNQGMVKGKSQKKQQISEIEKSVTMQGQGMYRTQPKGQQDRMMRRSSGMVSNNQGTLNRNLANKTATYAVKSGEIQGQGLTRGLSKRDMAQLMKSSSLMNSIYQGNIKGYSASALRGRYTKKAGLASRTGLISGLTVQQKDAGYMAKSVENLNQGLAKGNGKKDIQSRFIKKSGEALDQGMVKGKTKKEKEQELSSNSYIESQYQGGIKGYSRKQQSGMLSQKANKNLHAGLISGLSIHQQSATYMAKSGENLGQGMMKGYSKKDIQSRYIKKSQEALDQGTVKGKSKKEKEQELSSNSYIQSGYQGGIKGYSRKQQAARLSQKSSEAQQVGMISGLTPQQKEANYMAKSGENLSQGLMKGYSRKDVESRYIKKSQEALDQGKLSGKTVKGRQEDTRDHSIAQSQFQGNVQGEGKSDKESKFIRKSREAGQSGLISGLTVQQKDAGYMAKSVEGLNQGLTTTNNARANESKYIRKSQEGLDQGMVKGKLKRERQQERMSNSIIQAFYSGEIKAGAKSNRESGYIHKSEEALDQGLIKGQSKKKMDNQLQSTSVAQSRYPGNLKENKKDLESKYIRKSQESLKSGLISGLTVQQKDAGYMAKSVEALNQGLIKGISRKDTESKYIRKSMEANVQGLVSSKASRKRENQGKSNSISQASFQGNITALNKATLTAKYIRNAIEIQQAGLIKGKTERAQENQLKQKSGQVSSYQGITRSYAATNKHAHDWKEWMSQTRYLQFPGMVKVNTQLISNLNNLRLSYRQAKFEINKQSRVESWWAFLWKKPLDQRKAPPPLRKPRYDPHEHEIWNY